MSPYNRAFKGAAVLSSILATAIPALADDPISIRGYFDTSFNYETGPGGSKGNQVGFINGGSARVFDTQGNGFRWQQASLFLSAALPSGFGGLVNITTGNDANVITAYGMDTGNYADLTQGYISYTKGAFSVLGGKFVTLAGQEVIDSANNWNFDRSILFGYAIPYTHTGLRATGTFGKIAVTAGVNNGWNQLKEFNSTSKTFEGNITFNATDKTTLAATVYTGSVVTGLNTTGNRTLVDAVLTYKLNPKTTVVLNGDYGTQANAGGGLALPDGRNSALWDGIAGYVHYDVNDKWGVTLRGETYNDRDGYTTGVKQYWSEGTLTLHYKPNTANEIKLEARTDHSNHSNFVSTTGATGNQFTSYGIQWLYKF